MSDTPRPSLGIAVVAFNSAGDIPALLASVATHCPDACVVVVDNSGDPGTRRVCDASPLDVRYVDPGGNLGYAAAVREAAGHLGTDLVLVLNPDVSLTTDPRSLAEGIGSRILTGVLVSPGAGWRPGDPPANLHPLPTVSRELLRSLVSYRAYRWRRGLSEPAPVPQADGAWLLGRRSTWEALGWLDDRFELYYEDVALGHTLARAGSLVAHPVVVGEHRGGSSASSARGLSYSLLGVSRVRYYHLAPVGRFPRLLGTVTSLTEFAVRSLARRPEGHAVRWRSLRLQLREASAPGSVWLLGSPRGMRPEPRARE